MADMQRFHSKAFSYIPHMITKNHSAFKITQPLDMVVLQSDKISSVRKQNQPIIYHIWIVALQYILVFWNTQRSSLGKETKGPNSYYR